MCVPSRSGRSSDTGQLVPLSPSQPPRLACSASPAFTPRLLRSSTPRDVRALHRFIVLCIPRTSLLPINRILTSILIKLICNVLLSHVEVPFVSMYKLYPRAAATNARRKIPVTQQVKLLLNKFKIFFDQSEECDIDETCTCNIVQSHQ